MTPHGFFTFLGFLFALVVCLLVGMAVTLAWGFIPAGLIGGVVGAILGWFIFMKEG